MLEIYDTFDTAVNINKLNVSDQRMETINMIGGSKKYKSIPFENFI